ncbi:oxidoreductase, short chain dehydrogenase/reductase family [Aspergillus saccharolyticus JOP 1030-1]|uniref:Short chain dehydrogenase n=1 Tax=Aspergillus saccharolyticus JOP 1030-1 TaxID=1450539 RepID=A0A318YZU7_9EURO|nr:short chain dehydrogenase [Aspergillus saccharolyticus JOP 1030-1]PYH40139.1 short chain dehydrogenase [Aspergillus saccharolyticus JOP 1030-1]
MASPTRKYINKLSGQHVLVLGGTSGIGFSVAEAALENGASVIISSSSSAKLERSVRRLQETYPELMSTQRVSGYVCDLANTHDLEENLRRLLDEATATQNGKLKLNHVVFTAGDAIQLSSLDKTTAEAIQASGVVRFVAPQILAKLLPSYMELSPVNSFTLTGGSVAHRPISGWSTMSGYASANEGLARGLALDLKPLRVNVVVPGVVYTEIFSGFPDEAVQAILQNARENNLTGTVGRPEDLAESYIYLMKDQYVTGSVVASNGGSLLV